MSKAKKKISYVCLECGDNYPRWQGQCTSCKEWNTVVEYTQPTTATSRVLGATSSKGGGYAGVQGSQVSKMSEVTVDVKHRVKTGLNELDRVLGGGMVSGSVVLISGDPGAGKTTLLTHLLGNTSSLMKSMYVTAEESLDQFKARAVDRMNVTFSDDNLYLMASDQIEDIIREAEEKQVKFLVVDSIQAVENAESTSPAGSISQVKTSAQILNRFCKQRGIILFLVGHVTKNSEVAGPRQLEHIVDATIHLDTNEGVIRTLRSRKNRFGDVDVVGLFQMTEKGMLSVDNPSKIFLTGLDAPVSGSAITCIRDGSRNLLLEVQSLVTETENEHPQRVCLGLSANRLKMISAVLRKHGGLKIYHDVYLNLIGGLKIPETDTSTDLAIAASLISSLSDEPIPKDSCFFGEISLSGEIRPVSGGVPRVNEAFKLGFKTCYIPHANYHKNMEKEVPAGCSIVKLQTVYDLIKNLK